MSKSRIDLGAFGERVAAAHLEAKGYRIVGRNFRTREGEIDIIAESEGALVFVEVRTRRGDEFGSAGESVTARKTAHLVAVAQAYAQSQDWAGDQRIDVVTVSLAADGRVLAVEHIEGAVEET